jgi:hypothetical protein
VRPIPPPPGRSEIVRRGGPQRSERSGDGHALVERVFPFGCLPHVDDIARDELGAAAERLDDHDLPAVHRLQVPKSMSVLDAQDGGRRGLAVVYDVPAASRDVY